ncbi:hypothetical protein RQP46_000586 [Phenoliferia psychrophenolica]
MQSLPVLPNVKRISPLVTRILGQNPGQYTLQGTNTYLVGHASALLLLDTAQGLPEYLPHLRSALSTYENPTVTDILLSHWHGDHIGGLADVLGLFASLKMRAPRVWKLPNPLKDADVDAILSKVPAESFVKPEGPTSALFHALRPSQVFKLDPATSLEVLHTPGHTTDSVSLFISSEQILFTADTVLGHGTAVFEDLGAYMSSLAACERRIEGEGTVQLYPGHGEVVQDGPAKIREYRAHRQQREDQVLLGLREHAGSVDGVTALTLTEGIYKDTIPTSLMPAATRGVILHLEKLLSENKVHRTPDTALDSDAPLPGWNDSWELRV